MTIGSLPVQPVAARIPLRGKRSHGRSSGLHAALTAASLIALLTTVIAVFGVGRHRLPG